MDLSPEQVIQHMVRRWGIYPSQAGGEFHSECPFEKEGEDRFLVWLNGRYWCRVCGAAGWLDDDRRDWSPPPGQAEHSLEQRRLEEERQAKLKEFMQGLKDDDVRFWHRCLTQPQIDYWNREGISLEAIERYQLGYNKEKIICHKGTFIKLPAYTIPIRHNGMLVQIQYRIENPPPMVGKYRQEHSLPTQPFFSWGEQFNDCVVVEGTKKSIVIAEALGIETGVQVAGLPGIEPGQHVLSQFSKYRRIWLIPDPGASQQGIRTATRLSGHSKVWLCSVHVKPDDLIVKYHRGRNTLLEILRQGRLIDGTNCRR